MTVRSLDEMRAFKRSEKELLDHKDYLEVQEKVGYRVTTVFVDMDLEALRARHRKSVGLSPNVIFIDEVFDYADHNFDSPKEEETPEQV